MSCFTIYYQDKEKRVRPIGSREEYLKLRGSACQRTLTTRARKGNLNAKKKLLQMNYSCLPQDGRLKGCRLPSGSVGMDVDFDPSLPDYRQRMEEVPRKVLEMKEQLGLLLLERSVSKGYHIVFRRHTELSQEGNLRWAQELLGVRYDEGAKDLTRVFFTTTDSEEDLLYLDDALFDNEPPPPPSGASVPPSPVPVPPPPASGAVPVPAPVPAPTPVPQALQTAAPAGEHPLSYLDLPYGKIIDKWWEMYYGGRTPVQSNRNTLTYELAVNLRHICGFNAQMLDRVIPCYDGFPQEEKLACIRSALETKQTQMPKRLREVIDALRADAGQEGNERQALEEVVVADDLYYNRRLSVKARPMGIRESIDAVGPSMVMTVLTAICPAIGALATGVEVLVHDRPTRLNLLAYICGEAASGKGSIDPVVDAWMAPVSFLDAASLEKEAAYRAQARKAKNAKVQPDEPETPVRYLTLNNTLANLSDRLGKTEGKHAFSFTCEADLVAQKWKSTICDYSVMLRQAFDGSSYHREAKSVEAVNVHIPHLFWNVTMCGTEDALYRVLSNTTDGLLSRFAIAHTPDNTYTPLDIHPHRLKEDQALRIGCMARLLMLMKGRLELPLLEERSRQWVEQVRRDALERDDRVKARCRMRDHVIAYRMTVCLMLCAAAEAMVQEYGEEGATQRLTEDPAAFVDWTVRAQTPEMLEAYDLIADSVIDNDLYFFRERMEQAGMAEGRSYSQRERRGKNDSIFASLPTVFGLEEAVQAARMEKGAVTANAVRLMLSHWLKQGLIVRKEGGWAKLKTLTVN